MKLEASHGRTVSHPTTADLEAALQTLDQDGSFVILSTAPEDYVQATDQVVEYRRGGRHFSAACTDELTRRRVFESFLDGNDQFEKLASWEDVTKTLGTPAAKPRDPAATTPKLKIPVSAIVIFLVMDAIIVLAITGWALGWFGGKG